MGPEIGVWAGLLTWLVGFDSPLAVLYKRVNFVSVYARGLTSIRSMLPFQGRGVLRDVEFNVF